MQIVLKTDFFISSLISAGQCSIFL